MFLFLLQACLQYNDICEAAPGCILRGSQGTSGGPSDLEHWGTIYSPGNSNGLISEIFERQKDAYLKRMI